MTVQLTQPEFQWLAGILQDIPEFGSVRDRRRLLESAFGGVERARAVLGRVDLEGPPRSAGVGLLQHLLAFGEVSPGRHALGVLLDELLINMGLSDDADFLSDLIVNYQLKPGTPPSVALVAPPPPVPDAASRYVFVSYARPDQAIA